MNTNSFKTYLISEQREYLSQKVGDVLTGVHELIQGGKQVGARQLVRHSEGIVNQIRKILHSSWPKTEQKYLRILQKCGVALAKCIDEKGDLNETLNSVRHEIEQLSHKLGEPINTLASPKKNVQPQEQKPPTPPPEEGELNTAQEEPKEPPQEPSPPPEGAS